MKRTIRFVGIGFLVAAVAAVAGCSLFNQVPVANFLWSPLEPLARVDVSFNDQSSDQGGLFGGGGIVSWNWDFGDGDSSTAPNPKHEYDKSGSYTVRLTVTDDAGESTTITKTVLVSPSLNGRWSGYIEDINGNPLSMTLEFSHSTTSIQGNATINNIRTPCSGISLDPSLKTVRLDLLGGGFNIRLEGRLDASERIMDGDWFNIGTGQKWWTWEVLL